MSTTVELVRANERYARLRAAISALADECEASAGIAAYDDWDVGYRCALRLEVTDLRVLLAAVDS